MKFSFLYQIFSLSLVKLTDFDSYIEVSDLDSLIAVKSSYIKSIEATLSELLSLQTNLEIQLKQIKISNTAGNIASIAGTALMFTPLFFFGMAAVGAGTAASLGSSAYEYFIESGAKENLVDVLERELEAEGNYFDYMVQVLSTSSKTAMLLKKSADLKRMYDVSRGYTVAYNGINGVANAIKAGTKMKAVGSLMGGVGAVLSAADIVMTWTMSSETSEQIGDLIKCREDALKEEYEELEVLGSRTLDYLLRDRYRELSFSHTK